MKKKIFEDGNRILFQTDKEEELLVKFTDDIVDAKGKVKGNAKGKGVVNARIAAHIYKVLASYHLPVRFRSQKSDRELIVKNADLFPFYARVTNVEKEGEPSTPHIDFILIEEDGEKTVDLKQLTSAGVVSKEQFNEIRHYVLKMNVILKDFYKRRGLELLAFTAQFGILPNDKIGLCSELTLDTCDIKEAGSRTKFTTSYIISHIDDAAELYERALNAILY